MEMAAEQPRTEQAEQMTLITQLQGDLHEMGKLDFLERCNNAAAFWFSMVNDE